MPALKSKTPVKPLAQTLKPARAPVSRALAKTAPEGLQPFCGIQSREREGRKA